MGGQSGDDFPQRQGAVRAVEHGKNGLLPMVNLIAATTRRTCRRATDSGLTRGGNMHPLQLMPEAHGHTPARVVDFRPRQTGRQCQFGHFQGPPSPALDAAAPID